MKKKRERIDEQGTNREARQTESDPLRVCRVRCLCPVLGGAARAPCFGPRDVLVRTGPGGGRIFFSGYRMVAVAA
ncbi:hypothetical protein [Pandoravirus japonicus]|uniref:Uncharacterized protein n=1 Tax=Pandoravirus japonicus TaxID=2823154 RepID=A0A811BQR7_9VIRU|nr:hypothetical protein [Pandoravirus japonicus]